MGTPAKEKIIVLTLIQERTELHLFHEPGEAHREPDQLYKAVGFEEPCLVTLLSNITASGVTSAKLLTLAQYSSAMSSMLTVLDCAARQESNHIAAKCSGRWIVMTITRPLLILRT
jgi:hypothetical protein